MIESRATRRFWKAFSGLPAEVQKNAVQAYRIFQSDPSYPSLQFKKLEGEENIYWCGSASATGHLVR